MSDKICFIKEQPVTDTVALPEPGFVRGPYRKTDGSWYEMDSAGTEKPIAAGTERPVEFNDNEGTIISSNISGYETFQEGNIVLASGLATNISLGGAATVGNVIALADGVLPNSLTALSASVLIGRNIMQGSSAVANGFQNVLIGERVMRSTTATNATGMVAIGYQAGENCQSASRSIYIGESSGKLSNRTNNVHIGYYSGYGSSGVYTTSLGYNSMGSVSSPSKTGSQNTAIGAFSLFNTTTSQYNTAVGSYALRANTTGNSNVAFGRSALYSNQTGQYNVCLGANSGDDLNSAFNECIFIGAGSRFVNAARHEDNVCALGGELTKIRKVIIGNGVEMKKGAHLQDILIRTGYLEAGVDSPINGTDIIYEAGEGAGTTSDAGSHIFRVGDMTTSTGNTDPSDYIDAFTISGDAATPGYLIASGGAECDGATWVNASDRNLKEEIREDHRGLDLVRELKPVTYNYKKDRRKKRRLGLIAQDVDSLLPEAVTKNRKGLGIDYASLVPVLINSIKELEKRVKELEAK